MRSTLGLHISCTALLACVAGCSSVSTTNRGRAAPAADRSAASDMAYLTGPAHRDRPEFVADEPHDAAAMPADVDWQAPSPAASFSLFGAMPGFGESEGLDPMENLRQASFATEGADTDPALAPARPTGRSPTST